jgi:hypothetical protein
VRGVTTAVVVFSLAAPAWAQIPIEPSYCDVGRTATVSGTILWSAGSLLLIKHNDGQCSVFAISFKTTRMPDTCLSRVRATGMVTTDDMWKRLVIQDPYEFSCY